ncbi:hypothetical protein AB205_0206230 [Aquarana catesbeiana]|uniref:Uncharacterized protein n=1 Tax=Aquarana catesbeiana TaxID=8400 RepID=A0A2G9Q9L8_AQUCT|nr:hypothetical protein AB205_0206230 [Aquarana catesbeiana]
MPGGTQESKILLTIDPAGVCSELTTFDKVSFTVLCGSTQGDVFPELRAVHSGKVIAEVMSSPCDHNISCDIVLNKSSSPERSDMDSISESPNSSTGRYLFTVLDTFPISCLPVPVVDFAGSSSGTTETGVVGSEFKAMSADETAIAVSLSGTFSATTGKVTACRSLSP